MKISESWLREWVDPAIETPQLVDQLTMAGLEVDGVEPVAPEFSGVVVGEIVEVAQHPDADKLWVCQVAGSGDQTLQVVCGAPNARAGLKVPFALVGAVLPGDLKIREAKLRGVESFGMLCAEQELGISDASEGLWELADDAPVGADLRDYLSLDDRIIEVDLTPNRGDCLSIRGVAREVGVLNQAQVAEQACDPVAPVTDRVFDVTLSAPRQCPKYAGRVLRNINPGASAPQWMQERLRRSGLRSIDPVVDVTNYVLLELGQPMHAFDLRKLQGGIDVRMAKQGEKLALLDGTDIELDDTTLVIADSGGAVAMAGIMGGAATAVTDTTTDIFLESAFFDPVCIAGKARSYRLHTDSSHRFERGVDHRLQELAIERATALLVDIVGGEPGPIIVKQNTGDLPQPAEVTLSSSGLAQQLGVEVPAEQVEDILTRLGMGHVDTQRIDDATTWQFRTPSWRFDIAIEADLVEEIARIYGYDNIPSTTVNAALPISGDPEGRLPLSVVREQLLADGFQEVVTYSFVDPDIQRLITPELQAVTLANPIASDMSVMRTSIWPGLLSVLRNNLNRQQNRVRAFEIGQVFTLSSDGLTQENRIAAIICGGAKPESWGAEVGDVDFFDLKGAVESLLSLTGEQGSYRFAADSHPALQVGQTARIEKSGDSIGHIGKLHPALSKQLDISRDAFVFELRLSEIQHAKVPVFQDVSKFPEVRRDLAFIVDQKVTFDEIKQVASNAAGKNLTDLKVFDVYQGKGIENNRKSVALGLTFQDTSRTLTEEEINQAASCVISALESQFEARLRG